MKKVVYLLCLIVAMMFASCGYSEEDLARAEYEGYQEGFKEGYNLAKYEAVGEIERAINENNEAAYEYGYDQGYDAGWNDCLETEGVTTYYGNARIEKDR